MARSLEVLPMKRRFFEHRLSEKEVVFVSLHRGLWSVFYGEDHFAGRTLLMVFCGWKRIQRQVTAKVFYVKNEFYIEKGSWLFSVKNCPFEDLKERESEREREGDRERERASLL